MLGFWRLWIPQQMRTLQQANAGLVHQPIVCTAYGAPRDKDHIPAGCNCILPESDSLTQTPFDPVAFYCVADSSADGESEADIGQLIGQNAQDQIPVRE